MQKPVRPSFARLAIAIAVPLAVLLAVYYAANGDLVHANNAARSTVKDEDKTSAHFKEGENTLLVKLVNRSTNWDGCVRIAPK